MEVCRCTISMRTTALDGLAVEASGSPPRFMMAVRHRIPPSWIVSLHARIAPSCACCSFLQERRVFFAAMSIRLPSMSETPAEWHAVEAMVMHSAWVDPVLSLFPCQLNSPCWSYCWTCFHLLAGIDSLITLA